MSRGCASTAVACLACRHGTALGRPRCSCGVGQRPTAPAEALLATDTGALLALGGEHVGVTGVLVTPAQVGVQGPGLDGVVWWLELATVNCRSGRPVLLLRRGDGRRLHHLGPTAAGSGPQDPPADHRRAGGPRPRGSQAASGESVSGGRAASAACRQGLSGRLRRQSLLSTCPQGPTTSVGGDPGHEVTGHAAFHHRGRQRRDVAGHPSAGDRPRGPCRRREPPGRSAQGVRGFRSGRPRPGPDARRRRGPG